MLARSCCSRLVFLLRLVTLRLVTLADKGVIACSISSVCLKTYSMEESMHDICFPVELGTL